MAAAVQSCTIRPGETVAALAYTPATTRSTREHQAGAGPRSVP
jgi:hypothetical protein